jgi:hypothetical protein
MSLGIGFNYKWLGLDISVGFPSSSAQSEKYGDTKRIDLQFGIYSNPIGADLHYQEYKGYYLANPSDFTSWDKDYLPQLPSMRVLTFGGNLFYIFNNKKFSYPAAYIGNQVQKRSAGSAVTGLFFVQDEVLTDDGFIPNEIYDSSYATYDLKSFQAWTLGVSAGYTYTFVISKKGFFINAAGMPGIGFRNYILKDLSGNLETEKLAALHLHFRTSIGYTRPKFILNLMGTFNIRNYEYKSYQLGISTEQVRLTFGWRFETKSSKRKGKLYE